MGITKEIAYFNAFYIKSADSNEHWHIEESRIKGGFNETPVDYGARAFLVDDKYGNERRENAMIFSGIYNSKTTVNDLNQFSIGASNTKAVDKANGSIQKLFAEDTALLILQEDKVNQAPVDKDFIFTAEGNPLSATSNVFIGSIIPYAGRYGIGTLPESFANKGNRKYFVDNKRNVVLRLSGGLGGGNGLTEISFYGMRDWFKDNLKNTTKAIGMYDNVHDQYVLHLEDSLNETNYTLAYDESSQGWSSFYTYYPEGGFTLNGTFYTLKNTNLWEQHATTSYNNFYGTGYTSSVELILNNQTSVIKHFQALNYEGTDGWSADNIKTEVDDSNYTDLGADIAKYDNAYFKNLDTNNLIGGSIFTKKENKYYSFLKNKSPIDENDILFGEQISGLKGAYLSLKLNTQGGETAKKELFAVSAEVTRSS